MFQNFAHSKLNWLPESGIGYYPVTEQPYGLEYFQKYVNMEDTPIGKALNEARINLVNKYTDSDVLDIGIGSGAFVKARANTYGYDINPYAIEWLIEHDKYRGIVRGADALTFWDSLEHIHNPTTHLQGAKRFVFVSCPIYRDVDHILKSKHFRPDEHCWYWTHEGLQLFLWQYGFEMLEHNTMETEIGREDIGSYVFKRN